ncbi:hypothetical protein AVEN_142550-1 [Araneus ventricosus]|uniref:Uncharacterized protein n=1 Tax=Araneus ventricosus TaxID=182803 RepID=A0A4Y2CFS6_ARAVE|nr:hypothetical protein AVEN_142550-1 [Araneus ventricosus]
MFFTYPHKKKYKGVVSGDVGGHGIGPPLPIQCLRKKPFVLSNMFRLSWSVYGMIFYKEYNIWVKVFSICLAIQNFQILFIAIISAALTKEAANSAREEKLSLLIWFSQDDMTSKKQVRQRFKKKAALTLWKIYVIDKSLVVSALGTLITYGFLMGSLSNYHMICLRNATSKNFTSKSSKVSYFSRFSTNLFISFKNFL